MLKTIVRAIVRPIIGMCNLRKNIAARSQQKRLEAAEYYSRQFCCIQDYQGKPYVWVHGIPSFAIDNFADHGRDVYTLDEACALMERMRAKYVDEHKNDNGRY